MAKDYLYLTIGDDPKGRGLLAVMTQGHPQWGDHRCVILTMEIVKTEQEAQVWFDRMKIERPWEPRN